MKKPSKLQHLKLLRSESNDDLNCCRLLLAKEYVKKYKNVNAVHMDYAMALMELARYKEAGNELSKAIRACPKEKLYIPYEQMGHLYYYKGDHQEAVKWFSKCIKINPDDATGYIYKGSALAKSGKLKLAENVHRKAIQCKNGCIDEAFLNLGYVLRAQEKYKEALTYFKKALNIDPNYKEAKLAIKDATKAIDYEKRFA